MDGLKEILAAFEARVRSKVIGSILLAFVATNWKALFYVVFERVSSEEKFLFFDENTSFVSLLVIPVFLGAVLALVLPWINFFGMKWTFLADRKQRQFKNNSQHLDVLDKMEYDTKVQEFKARKQRAIVESAKAGEDAKSIEDPLVRKQVEEDLDDLGGTMTPFDFEVFSSKQRGGSALYENESVEFQSKSLDELHNDSSRLKEIFIALSDDWHEIQNKIEELDQYESANEREFTEKLNEILSGVSDEDSMALRISRAKEIEDYSKKRKVLVSQQDSNAHNADEITGYQENLSQYLSSRYGI